MRVLHADADRQDGREPDRRSVVVGDLRPPDLLTTLLSGRGIFPRQ